jgi:SagB-type dehydrogenase family enzyme
MEPMTLSTLLLLSYSLTAQARYAGGSFYYRSVPSAGALYPCELYLETERVDKMEPGLYHYAVHRHGLVPLRRGRYSRIVEEFLVSRIDRPALATIFVTAIFFRSSWKYGDRAYRYHLLDAGHLIEGLLLSLQALGFQHELVLDFHDEAVNTFLSVDEKREACLAVVRILGAPHDLSGEESDSVHELPQGIREASAVAPREYPYPLILEIHGSSSWILRDPGKVDPMAGYLGLSTGSPLSPPLHKRKETLAFWESVRKRRSKRNFVLRRLDPEKWSLLIHALALRGASPDPGPFVTIGILNGSLERLETGFHLLSNETLPKLLPSGKGPSLREMAHACLDQMWLAHCALHIVFLTNLQRLDHLWGPRGYRHAMIHAGRLGHKVYLAATSLGLGACGIGAFYDQEAASLLGLNEESRMLYLVGAGPIKK